MIILDNCNADSTTPNLLALLEPKKSAFSLKKWEAASDNNNREAVNANTLAVTPIAATNPLQYPTEQIDIDIVKNLNNSIDNTDRFLKNLSIDSKENEKTI